MMHTNQGSYIDHEKMVWGGKEVVVMTFIDAQEASNYVEYIKYSVQCSHQFDMDRKEKVGKKRNKK